MLGNREHRGEWGVVPDGAKRPCGSRRIEPLPTPHPLWYLALCALIVTGCSSDGRTPLVIYSPHGRDLLTLLERRFEQLRPGVDVRSEEHTSELQSPCNLVCRLLLEKKKNTKEDERIHEAKRRV